MTILLSIWVQIASLFFLLSGIHNDILVIRFYLYLAYTMLLVNACLGSPLWPNWIVWGTTNDPNDDDYNDKVNQNNSYTISFQKIAIDVLFWSVLSPYVHEPAWWRCSRMNDIPNSRTTKPPCGG